MMGLGAPPCWPLFSSPGVQVGAFFQFSCLLNDTMVGRLECSLVYLGSLRVEIVPDVDD